MKPAVKLIGTDGNAYLIIGACCKALRRAGMRNKAEELMHTALAASSYDNLLQICMDYVEIS